MIDWIKKFLKFKKRFLEWKEIPKGSEFDYNYWCPFCERWVENGLFSNGGEWERKRFSNGGGDVRYYDTGKCKKCGAKIKVNRKYASILEAFDF
jgi:hypothetical protein